MGETLRRCFVAQQKLVGTGGKCAFQSLVMFQPRWLAGLALKVTWLASAFFFLFCFVFSF